jgi:hypothetical protein
MRARASDNAGFAGVYGHNNSSLMCSRHFAIFQTLGRDGVQKQSISAAGCSIVNSTILRAAQRDKYLQAELIDLHKRDLIRIGVC